MRMRHDLSIMLCSTLLDCACRKSNPKILVVQPAQDRAAKNGPGQFDGARDRRILLQRQMRPYLVVIVHVRLQHVTEVALTEHNNVVKAFPSDRLADRSGRVFCCLCFGLTGERKRQLIDVLT